MLLGQRRSSVDSFISEEDAAKALKEQEENLRLFKERVQTGHKAFLFLILNFPDPYCSHLSGRVSDATFCHPPSKKFVLISDMTFPARIDKHDKIPLTPSRP